MRHFRPGAVVVAGGLTVQSLPETVSPRVTFRVTRSITSTPDSAEIAIYNLEPARRLLATRGFLDLGIASVELRAGYDGVLRRLFRGDMRSAAPRRNEEADIATVITADDAGDAISDVTVRLTSRGFAPRDMIDVALAFIAQGGALARVPPLPGQVIVKDPSVDAALAASPSAQAIYTAVSIGTASELLDEAARICRCRWYVQDGVLYFARLGLPTQPSRAAVLGRDLLLSEPSRDGSKLIRVSTLMDTSIVPGGQVVVEGAFYRVEHATYVGDTEGDAPWSLELVGRQLSTP